MRSSPVRYVNVTFIKELFYSSTRELEVIPIAKAIVLIELLYKFRDILNRETLSIIEQDLLLILFTR